MARTKKKTNSVINKSPKRLIGTTKSGYEYNLDSRVFNDYRFIELIGKSNSKDEMEQIQSATALVDLIFKDKKEDFLRHLAGEDDYIDFQTVFNEITEIFQTQTKTLKNS